jgi:beta-galactosidase
MRENWFNAGWTVRREGAEPDAAVAVRLPHDAMFFEHRDPSTPNGQHTGYYPGGVYRYAKTFMAPPEWAEQVVALEFEGVYQRSSVYLNGELIGGHASGYAGFQVRLDPGLRLGRQNTVEVVAHNDEMPNSRWYTGSGIYRPVRLLLGSRLHLAAGGVCVTTVALDGDAALLDVTAEIVNEDARPQEVSVAFALGGESQERMLGRTWLAPGERTSLSRRLRVPGAELWSPEEPRLTEATARLSDEAGLRDEASVSFGIRTITADARHGLRINGATVKLRGACIHHDNGVIGAHTLAAAEDRRVRLLKEAGYNAIRSAHNPASEALLAACDRHGVLVMDELSDVWTRPKTPHDYSRDFERDWPADLEAMVRKDRNHPSVIMYSIGNEIAETAFASGIRLNRELAARTRELDPGRLVVNGVNGFLNLLARPVAAPSRLIGETPGTERSEGRGEIAVMNLLLGALEKVFDPIVRLPAVDRRTRDVYADLDVAGYNYMSARYELDGRRHPHRVIVGSETAPTDTVAIWRALPGLPHVIGDFVWAAWDYIGEAGVAVRQYNEPQRLSHPYPALLAGEPVIDITGHRQTQSYLNEIVWGLRREPYIAVQPVNHSGERQSSTHWRSTDSVRSWNWQGLEGRQAVVEVYADAARVELLLDGARVGAHRLRPRDEYLATFTVPYRPGTLTAIAYDADGAEIGRDVLASGAGPVRLRVTAENETLLADGDDLAFVQIELVDAEGGRWPLADRRVRVEVAGAAALLGAGSGAAITADEYASGVCTTHNGHALAVVRAGTAAGSATVRVTAGELTETLSLTCSTP